MVINYKSTTFDLKLKNSSCNIGLRANDYWYSCDVYVQNSEFSCNYTKDLLADSELRRLIRELHAFLNDEFLSKRISFIKNYFVIYLKRNKEHKKMTIKLIGDAQMSFKNYQLEFIDTEIDQFLALLSS